MEKGEVKPCKPEGPAGLPAVQVLGHSEVHEVPVVIQDLYHVLSIKNCSNLFQPGTYEPNEELVIFCLIHLDLGM